MGWDGMGWDRLGARSFSTIYYSIPLPTLSSLFTVPPFLRVPIKQTAFRFNGTLNVFPSSQIRVSAFFTLSYFRIFALSHLRTFVLFEQTAHKTKEKKLQNKTASTLFNRKLTKFIYCSDQSREMPGIHTVCIAILLTVLLLFDRCFGYPSIRQQKHIEKLLCESCGDSCDKCEFGSVISVACGVEQCAKGPDQLCGGPSNIFGSCGDGMYCNCNKCIGCSSEKFECSKKDPCLPNKIDLIDRFERLLTTL